MPDIEVSAFCERAQKHVRLKMPLEEARVFFDRQQAKQQSAEEFRQAFALEHAKDNFPDLIVYYKGQYVVHASVFPSKESSVLVLLKTLTRAAVFGYQKKVRRRKNSSNNGTRQYAPLMLRTSEANSEEVRGI